MKIDYLIVGSGFAGCVLAERIATQLDKKVLIVEQRDHIGGNSYDEYDKNGVLIHKYGPHIFHTQHQKVWDYLSRFTEWIPYEHRVLAHIEGKNVPVPFNLSSLEMCFSEERALRLQQLLTENYGMEIKIPILKLMETSEPELKNLAEFIYKNVFLGYTTKQWGLKPEELDFSVSSRVPVFISRDDRYFQDRFQGIPKNGYTAMFNKMTEHTNIDFIYNTDYKNIVDTLDYEKLIYTGPIDYYFDYKFGKLPYRSLEFKFRNLSQKYFQERAQINFPNDHDYTRITEFKHLTKQEIDSTSIAYEYPKEYIHGKNDPYYPIIKAENQLLFDKYNEEAKKLEGKVFFVGRLAEYKYYNMDQIVGVSLLKFNKEILKYQ